jgi:aldehyde dehydrogenase (NAD+)
MNPPNIPSEPADYDMFIDGSSMASESGERFDIEYPYDRSVWATAPRGNEHDVDMAVTAAQECFESDEWQKMTATQRGNLLFEFANVLEDHTEELGRLESLSNGKLFSAMNAQAEALPKWYRYYAGLADKITGTTIPVDDDRMFNFTLKEPYGVVGAITPWNSPLMLATYKIAPAIAAGNTVVLKPSELTPISAIRLAELANKAGWPDGALNVVTGFARPGAALTEHNCVQKVAFTGGLETGSTVGETAGRNIKDVTLELGGKSPNIVFPDADMDKAVTGAIKGIFAASGQTCIAGSRLFLHESIIDDFVDELLSETRKIRMGDPFDEDSEIGPIAFQGQLEKIQKHVNIAKSEGAKLACGGEPRDDLPGGLFFPPTILTDVDNNMKIAQKEVFGPVLSVLSFSNEADVIRKANDSNFGLAAGVWTNDLRRAVRMSNNLEAGVVWVNTYRKSSFTTPFGGYKKSGIGVEKGVEALDDYLQIKSVWMELEGELSNPFHLI